MAEGNEGFVLPFQWDDGEHFAPVVFTKEEDLQAITQILLFENKQHQDENSSEIEESEKKTVKFLPSGPIEEGEIFIDAGCGNGRVPLFVAASLLTKKTKQNVKILGVDIEEELVEKANKEAQSLGFTPEQVKFVAGDLRKSVDLLKSCHFIYCYLLPGEMLTELMNEITKEWNEEQPSKKSTSTRVIISNTWEINCLKDFRVGRIGEMWIYDRFAKK